jgi:hypothetical protein
MSTYGSSVIIESEVVVEETRRTAPATCDPAGLEAAAHSLDKFARQYPQLEAPGIDTDDEILNWVYTEAICDLRSAIWNAAGGHYKVAMHCLRNAHEIGTLAVCFQIMQNGQPCNQGYHPSFDGWTWGRTDTPGWREMKRCITLHHEVGVFQRRSGSDFVAALHQHFAFLCNFTHSRAFDRHRREPTQTLWMTGDVGRFDPALLERFRSAFLLTVSWSASLWLLCFPALYESARADGFSPEPLITHPLGLEVLRFAAKSCVGNSQGRVP